MTLTIALCLGAIAALAILILVVVVVGRRRLEQLERKCDALTLLLKAVEKQNESRKREVTEIRSGALGVGRRVKELEQQFTLLQARQDEVSQKDPEARLYSRAMKMVELGAGVDEVIRECELPPAEAQLLVTLHQKQG